MLEAFDGVYIPEDGIGGVAFEGDAEIAEFLVPGGDGSVHGKRERSKPHGFARGSLTGPLLGMKFLDWASDLACWKIR